MPHPALRVLLAAFAPVEREGIRQILEEEGGLLVAGVVARWRDVPREAARLGVKVIVANGDAGDSGAGRMLSGLAGRGTGILLLCRDGYGAVRWDLMGWGLPCLNKGCSRPELIAAVRAAGRGVHVGPPAGSGEPRHMRLTPREKEVFRFLAQGMGNKGLAERLGLSAKTVASYRARVFRKMGFRNIADLVRYAVRHRLLEEADG